MKPDNSLAAGLADAQEVMDRHLAVGQLMSDLQNPSTSVQPSESDDLGVIQETVLQDSSSGVGNSQSGFLFRHLDFLVTAISQKYDIERLQVGLGLLLLFLLLFFCLCIAVAWRYYSPIIVNYTIKEQEERARRSSEKDKQGKEKSKFSYIFL